MKMVGTKNFRRTTRRWKSKLEAIDSFAPTVCLTLLTASSFSTFFYPTDFFPTTHTFFCVILHSIGSAVFHGGVSDCA